MQLNLDNFDSVFKTSQDCLRHLAKERWPNGVACLFCGSESIYSLKRRSAYECKDCGKQFNPRTNTPFENSPIPLRKWYRALYLLTSFKKGISSPQLAHELQISQPAAWSMMHRLRQVMGLDFEQLKGTVQVDETYFFPRRHRRTTAKYTKKVAVIGIVEQLAGRSRIRVLATKYADATVALPFIRASIKQGTRVHTDGSTIYHRVHHDFQHRSVNHSRWQWADGDVTTNGIESFWSHFKRGVRGIYLQVSARHLQRYADEFAFKHNTRWLCQGDRFNAWFRGLNRPGGLDAP